MFQTFRFFRMKDRLAYFYGVSLLSGVAMAVLAGACGGEPTPPAAVPARPAPPAAPMSVLAAPARKGPAVPAARRPVVHEYFGTKVTDDYEWLEDPKNAEVKIGRAHV